MKCGVYKKVCFHTWMRPLWESNEDEKIAGDLAQPVQGLRHKHVNWHLIHRWKMPGGLLHTFNPKAEKWGRQVRGVHWLVSCTRSVSPSYLRVWTHTGIKMLLSWSIMNCRYSQKERSEWQCSISFSRNLALKRWKVLPPRGGGSAANRRTLILDIRVFIPGDLGVEHYAANSSFEDK